MSAFLAHTYTRILCCFTASKEDAAVLGSSLAASRRSSFAFKLCCSQISLPASLLFSCLLEEPAPKTGQATSIEGLTCWLRTMKFNSGCCELAYVFEACGHLPALSPSRLGVSWMQGQGSLRMEPDAKTREDYSTCCFWSAVPYPEANHIQNCEKALIPPIFPRSDITKFSVNCSGEIECLVPTRS